MVSASLAQAAASLFFLIFSLPFLQSALPGGGGAAPLENPAEIHRYQFPEMHPPQPLLPDLRTLPPSDLLLQILRGQDRTRLRFTNTIWNSGPGDLEMRAGPHPVPGAVWVSQVVALENGVEAAFDAGLFEYDIPHEHWHWEGFSIYQVWSLAPDGSLSEIVASSDKIGYCLLDMAPYPGADAPPFPEGMAPPEQAQFGGCNWRRQGISAGWIDAYRTQVEGQFVEITGLPDGLYALLSLVNPGGIIRETDGSNNGAVVYFRLEGEQVFTIGTTPDFLRSAEPLPDYR